MRLMFDEGVQFNNVGQKEAGLEVGIGDTVPW
jgi:hypothetical protein